MINKNYVRLNVHYGITLFIALLFNTIMINDFMTWFILMILINLGSIGGMIPFKETGKCFLVVLYESIKKRKFLFPRVYKGKVLVLVYFLLIQYFIINFCIIIWILNNLIVPLFSN